MTPNNAIELTVGSHALASAAHCQFARRIDGLRARAGGDPMEESGY
jgi:hypothetical protein